jgi:hypothetical protein
MAQVSGTTDSYDIVGIAEDVEDAIFMISPTDTPLLTMAKRKTATATNHQWQTDSLAAAGANRQIEGDDASYTTASPTVMLSNRTQISRKTVIVSRTADKVKKYGRARELARIVTKQGKEIKRDVEYALVRDQASSVGGSATARSSAGLESMISGNRVLSTSSTAGTTPGYSGGDWAAPTDGTATTTLTEAFLKTALEAAWVDGGDPGTIMSNTFQKKMASAFVGASAYDGFQGPQGKTQGAIIGAVDVYVSDFGSHKWVLNRYMKTTTVFCLDPEFISVAWLDPFKLHDLAKTGDAEKKMLIGEFTLVNDNPDAHSKLQDFAAS